MAGSAGANGEIARLVRAGAGDVVIVNEATLGNLNKDGLIDAKTQRVVVRANLGLGVRHGAALPDIATLDKLRNVLTSTPSLTHNDPAGGSSSGIIAARVIETLGLKGKVHETPITLEAATAKGVVVRGRRVGNTLSLPSAAGGDESGGTLAVKRGEIALAMYPVSALMEAGLDAVPLPRDANASIDYVGAVTAAAASPAQAEAFLRFITRAQTLAAWKAKGMDLTN